MRLHPQNPIPEKKSASSYRILERYNRFTPQHLDAENNWVPIDFGPTFYSLQEAKSYITHKLYPPEDIYHPYP